GDEERRRDVVPLEQIEDPRHGDSAELAAGKRRDVPRGHVEDPRRQRIEVEGQAHRQPGAHRPIMGQANVAGGGTRSKTNWSEDGGTIVAVKPRPPFVRYFNMAEGLIASASTGGVAKARATGVEPSLITPSGFAVNANA